MSNTKTYTVKRPHKGDKFYNVGDPRKARPQDVDHLVARGVLAEGKPKAEKDQGGKAAKPAANKAEPKPVANKSEGGTAVDGGTKSEASASE